MVPGPAETVIFTGDDPATIEPELGDWLKTCPAGMVALLAIVTVPM